MDYEKILPILAAFTGMIIGSIITIVLSQLDRKHKKRMLELEISHKKILFDLEKTQRQEIFCSERRDKFRLIAIDKRLEAHQLALVHWYKLRDVIHENDDDLREEVVEAAFEFWKTHCLYLEKQTQKMFYEAIAITRNHKTNKQIFQEANDRTEKERLNKILQDNWNNFYKTHPVIFSEVELEPFSIETKGNAFSEE